MGVESGHNKTRENLAAPEREERRSWLIRKKAGAGLPFDHPEASIVGPDTDVVGVIPEQDAEQLREALRQIAEPPLMSDAHPQLWQRIEIARAALEEKGKLDG